jgi:hypothetical protein
MIGESESAMGSPTGCDERRRLDELYAVAKTELSNILMELSTLAASPENTAFERAWAACEAQRRVFSQIRDQTFDHIRQHRCSLVRRAT